MELMASTATPYPNATLRHLTPEIKAKNACIGTCLSDNKHAKQIQGGQCFRCGEQGHRHPDCPHKETRTQVTVVEPAETQVYPDLNPTCDESKN